ncbi:MAG: AAA family ATPase [Bacteroidota bacterium]|nr:AAA family ATPase [Bacteroidota bacterium]
MENIKIKSLGPIEDANVNFGNLTLLVGPQASGKSIFIQMLKLIIDKKHIRKTLEQYNFVWSKDSDDLFDLFFGDGMHGIWKDNTEILFDSKPVDKGYWLPKQKESFKNSDEIMFYIPAQRILSISDGRPKYFTEFDESVPYVLRHFSETLRQLMQSDIGKHGSVFPLSQRLKAPLRNSFNDSIFHNGKIVIENISGQRKFRMQIDGLSIPFMTWSAGQKEFMPLLLSFYWLCTSSKISRRDEIKYVVIEEPEMGLHPQAIKSVILQVIDLLSRDYKVIISTHSPVFLEFAWAFNLLKQSNVSSDSLFELFDIKRTAPTKRLFENIIENKTINTYYFDRENDKVSVKDISSLDAGSENESISNWGGLSEFSGKAVDIVSKYYTED